MKNLISVLLVGLVPLAAQAGVVCKVTQGGGPAGTLTIAEYRDVQETPDFENVLAYDFRLADGSAGSFVYRLAQVNYTQYVNFVEIHGSGMKDCKRGEATKTGAKTSCGAPDGGTVAVDCRW